VAAPPALGPDRHDRRARDRSGAVGPKRCRLLDGRAVDLAEVVNANHDELVVDPVSSNSVPVWKRRLSEWPTTDLSASAAAQLVTALVDTSVLIDYLRGHHGAAELLEQERTAAPLHASEMTRLEILAGMRPVEADGTQSLLSTLLWHPVDQEIAEEAGILGRRWLPRHHTIDGADPAIAATAVRTGSRLLTRNVGHFPMFKDLQAPY